jgi:hypothetical protein
MGRSVSLFGEARSSFAVVAKNRRGAPLVGTERRTLIPATFFVKASLPGTVAKAS